MANLDEYLKEDLFRLNIEKSINYIETKVSNSVNDCEKKLNVTKILSFVNDNFSGLYLKSKGIDLTVPTEEIMEEKNKLMRKSADDPKPKYKKSTVKKVEKEISKNQRTLFNFLKK